MLVRALLLLLALCGPAEALQQVLKVPTAPIAIGIPGLSKPGSGGGGSGDAFFSSTVLIVNPAGADGSTSLTDQSFAANGAATPAGSAQIDTGVTYGGNPTLLFAYDSAWRWPDAIGWTFGGGPFAVEVGTTLAGPMHFTRVLVGQWDAGSDKSWVLHYNGQLVFSYSTTGSDQVDITSSGWAPVADTFYELTANYDGTTIRLFANGVMIGSSAVGSITIRASANTLALGSFSSPNAELFGGSMGRVRLTKGQSRGYGGGGYSPLAAGYYPVTGP